MNKVYYSNKEIKEIKTKVENVLDIDGKQFLLLEDSIFYPQGGGQKGDKGSVEMDGVTYTVLKTIKDEDFNSLIIVDKPLSTDLIGKEANCTLDYDFRYKQMRMHTALHMHHCAIEKVVGSPIKYPTQSNIEEDFAYNKYTDDTFDINTIDQINEVFNEWIHSKEVVTTYPDEENENFRYWTCMGYVIPCGGIHVTTLDEIGDVKIEVAHKKKKITVKVIL